MTLPAVIATGRLSLPLWDARDIAAIRGEIPRSPHWHPDFPRHDDVDAAGLWHEGDPWGPRSIVRGQTVLGSIGFFGPPSPADEGVAETEVGFGLVEEARGWGFATEALNACVAAAEAAGVRLRASVEPTNAASLRVLAKAGFTVMRGATEGGHLIMVRPIGETAKPARGRSRYVVEGARELDGDPSLWTAVLGVLRPDAESFEADIPWATSADWPAEIRAAAERLVAIARKPGQETGYGQTGVVRRFDDEAWSAFTVFGPYAYDASVWGASGIIASLSDCGTGYVRLTDEQYRAAVTLVPEGTLVAM